MSVRIIDEIYAALHNGEKPPYTNARELWLPCDKSLFEYFFDEKPYKFVPLHNAILVVPKFYIPPIVD